MIDLLKLGVDEGITADGIAEALRRRAKDVPDEELDELAALLEQYLRSIPGAIATALGFANDPHCGRAVAFATGTILTYIFNEKDLLPEASFGIVGLLDDAYLVHGFVAALGRTYPFAEPDAAAYEAPDERTSQVVASLLPDGVAPSLLRTCESTIQVAQALFPSQMEASPEIVLQPELRVAEAVAAATRSPSRA